MPLDKDIIELITGKLDIKLVILFGSLSRGQGNVDSDLDLAISGSRSLTVKEKTDIIGELAQITGRPIDLIDLQMTSGTILHQVLTTGQLIYCSDRNYYAELIKKMLFDQADFMPYRSRILEARRHAWISA